MTYGDDEVITYLQDTYNLVDLVKLLEGEGEITLDDFLETYENEILNCKEIFEEEMMEEYGEFYGEE